MPRSKKGVKRTPVNQQNITCAVNRVLSKDLSIREASRTYNVSKTTLIRHLSKYRKIEDSAEFRYQANNKTKQVFSAQEENSLKDYLITAARLHYGLTKMEVRCLAYQFAIANEKKCPPTWKEHKKAGKEWLRYFLKRYHPHLSLRKPEPTSLARSTSFNKANVTSFFNNYKLVLSRNEFPPHKIWNCDESGFPTVHVPPKIIGPKGIKQLGQMTSGERGQNVTCIAAISASGNHIPPMLIFPRVNFKAHMLKGAPVGSIGGANSSGWSNGQLFLEFLEHFKNHVKPSVEDPIILLLDNHDSHVNIPVIEFCKMNGIILVSFHPHTSHKMQPLDRTVFGPMKTYYNAACSEWMLIHPGQPISIYDIAELIGKAFPKAFSQSNIVKGFEVSGLYPINKDIFQENEFLTSYVTDRPLVLESEQQPSTSSTSSLRDSGTANSENSASTTFSNNPCNTITSDTVHKTVTPEMIRPYPKALPRKKAVGGRPRGKSRILTDTPEKLEIAALKKVNLKLTKSTKKQVFGDSVQKISQKNVVSIPHKKTRKISSSSESENNLSTSSGSGEDQTWIKEIEREQEELILEKNFEDADIRIGDFVLVKVAGKKRFRYYVAEVMRYGDDNELKYLRRFKDTNKFLNDATTTFSFLKEDIISKLPPPSNVGGTARNAAMLCFGVNFGHYSVE